MIQAKKDHPLLKLEEKERLKTAQIQQKLKDSIIFSFNNFNMTLNNVKHLANNFTILFLIVKVVVVVVRSL